eukprot:8159776-Prorocentrum_lima.AAC.1
MTSSLVGSEMCIRDSAAQSVVGHAGTSKRGQSCGASQRHAAAQGSPAVSYTHLTLPTICSV